jgi:hypothetical protein
MNLTTANTMAELTLATSFELFPKLPIELRIKIGSGSGASVSEEEFAFEACLKRISDHSLQAEQLLTSPFSSGKMLKTSCQHE